jgi:DNA invertase Pin-like site-specific DNA recombinase
MVEVRSAAIYARISRDATGEGLGVERQLKECRRLAEQRGWTVAEEYVDNDISAYRGKRRPAYEQMLADIEAGRRDAVVAYHLDRLTRRPADLEQFVNVCERVGVRTFATVVSDINIGNEDGLLMARILAAFAAQESSRKSARLKSKARELAEAGKPNGGYRRPFGYEADRVTVRESEAVIIRDLAARYLAGESLMSLARWLTEAGVPTVGETAWRTGSIRSVLTSPRIAGLRSHNGEVVGEAVWPAIITPAQHHQLLAAFSRKKINGRRTARRYLLSGMLRCEHCGNKLFSSARRDGDRQRRRYVCSSGPDHGGCGRLTVVAEPVEEWITEAVLYRLDTPAMAHALTGRAAADERHASLLATLESDRAQMLELTDLWNAKQISTAEWMHARRPIEDRIKDSERQLGHLTGNTAIDGYVGRGDELRAQWDDLNLTRQAAIIAAVLDHATIRPGDPGARAFDPNRIIPTWRL